MVITSDDIHCFIIKIVSDPPAPSKAEFSSSVTPASLSSPLFPSEEKCPLCIEEIDTAKMLHCTRCDKAACFSCLESYLRDGSYHKCPYCNLPFVCVRESWAMPDLKKLMYEDEWVPEPVWGGNMTWGEVEVSEEGSGVGESDIWGWGGVAPPQKVRM